MTGQLLGVVETDVVSTSRAMRSSRVAVDERDVAGEGLEAAVVLAGDLGADELELGRGVEGELLSPAAPGLGASPFAGSGALLCRRLLDLGLGCSRRVGVAGSDRQRSDHEGIADHGSPFEASLMPRSATTFMRIIRSRTVSRARILGHECRVAPAELFRAGSADPRILEIRRHWTARCWARAVSTSGTRPRAMLGVRVSRRRPEARRDPRGLAVVLERTVCRGPGHPIRRGVA